MYEEVVLPGTNYKDVDTEASKPQLISSVVLMLFDSNRAVAITSQEEFRMQTANIDTSASSTKNDKPSPSNNVELLIKEADQAFQTIGNELEHAAEDWYGISNTESSARTVTLPRAISKIQPSSSLPSKYAITRTRSGVKDRKTFFQCRRPKLVTKTAFRNKNTGYYHTRWTDVTNNMAGAIGGMIFKTTVDEILSPGKLEKLGNTNRARRVSLSMEDTITESKITQIEPFHSGSLSSRVSVPGPQISLSPVSPMTPDSSNLPPMPSKSGARVAKNILNSPILKEKMSFEGLSFPSQSLSSMSRSTYTDNVFLSLSRKSLPSQLVLPSTPYTLNCPLFRHGHIVIDRPHLKQEDMRADELIDWTAFQMAIAGTTHEELEGRLGEVELDDIAEWWEGFGLELGELVHEKPKLRKRSSVVVLDKPSQRIRQSKEGSDVGGAGDAMERNGTKDRSISPVGRSPQICASLHSIVPWDIY